MPKLRSKKFAITVFLLLILVAGVIILHTRSVHKAQHTSGTIPNSKKTVTSGAKVGNSKKSQKTSASSASSSTKTQGPAVTSSAGSASLIAPFGTFVSNHKPGQSGSPTSEQSVCNTTPGATCDIQFTNSAGVTKSLGAEVAGSSGTAFWSWDIKGGTLAPGSWKITAVVKLNGQTSTTSDPTPLEVQ